jgi:single-strand DNA-binding protein
MNSVILIGRLTKDPELSYTPSQTAVCRFTLAVDKARKTEDQSADFIRITVWDKQAETAGEYIKKGRLVAIDGRLRFDKWTAQDGESRERPIITVNNFRLLGGRND